MTVEKHQQAETYLSQGKLAAAYGICQEILVKSSSFTPADNTQGKILHAMRKIESTVAK